MRYLAPRQTIVSSVLILASFLMESYNTIDQEVGYLLQKYNYFLKLTKTMNISEWKSARIGF